MLIPWGRTGVTVFGIARVVRTALRLTTTCSGVTSRADLCKVRYPWRDSEGAAILTNFYDYMIARSLGPYSGLSSVLFPA